MRARRRLLAAGAGMVALAAGCTSAPTDRQQPEPVQLRWVESAALPLPTGVSGRISLSEAAGCDGVWYVVGAVVDAQGGTQPAVWSSPDARAWTALKLSPHSFYGRQHILYTAACRDGKLAAFGAKPGGVHGNPRSSSWHQLPDGTLDEVIAGYQLYAGPDAVAVSRIAAGPAGWLLAGTRTSGAAVWVSPDSADFTIVEKAPNLASDAQWDTIASDAAASSGRWVVVGAGTRRGQVGRDPLAWTSTDGRRWDRVEVPADDTYEELHRVVPVADGVLAAGVRGQTFSAWRGDGTGWRAAGRFGSTQGDRVPTLPGLAAVGDTVLAVAGAGDAYTLWMSTDAGAGWRPAVLPGVAKPVNGQATAVAAAEGNFLLLVDDGQTARVWLASAKPGA